MAERVIATLSRTRERQLSEHGERREQLSSGLRIATEPVVCAKLFERVGAVLASAGPHKKTTPCAMHEVAEVQGGDALACIAGRAMRVAPAGKGEMAFAGAQFKSAMSLACLRRGVRGAQPAAAIMPCGRRRPVRRPGPCPGRPGGRRSCASGRARTDARVLASAFRSCSRFRAGRAQSWTAFRD